MNILMEQNTYWLNKDNMIRRSNIINNSYQKYSQ